MRKALHLLSLLLFIASALWGQNEQPNGKMIVEIHQDGQYMPVATFPASQYPQTFEADLDESYRGDLNVRIRKEGGGLGFADLLLIDGQAGKANAYKTKKLGNDDLDVIEITADGMELRFTGVTKGRLVLKALIEPEVIEGVPFYKDVIVENGDVSWTLAKYKKQNRGTITIDGTPDRLDPADAFRVYDTYPSTGHPDSKAWIWLYNDDRYLYVACEWGSDNTFDYGADFFRLYVDVEGEIKAFTQWSDRGEYGRPAFAYTDLLPYQHMCYEMKIPLAELGRSDELSLGFGLYGTAGHWFVNDPSEVVAGETMNPVSVAAPASQQIGLILCTTEGVEIEENWLTGGESITPAGNDIIGYTGYKEAVFDNLKISEPGTYKLGLLINGNFYNNVSSPFTVLGSSASVQTHTVTLELAPGIQANHSPGALTVIDGSHLHLSFYAEDRTIIGKDVVLFLDGQETAFKDFGPNFYFSYILNPIEGDHTIRIALRNYPVTLPEVKGAITDPAAGIYPTALDQPFHFKLTLEEGYDQSEVKVFANGQLLQANATRSTDYNYTLPKVSGPIEIAIEGVASNDPTGNTVLPPAIRLNVEDGKLKVVSQKAMDIRIYAPTGTLKAAERINGTQWIALPTGVYIIRIGNETHKLWINP
ncbi:hypothetical protein [Parabacteroides sp. PF5-6]|uniref:hypothetical protein n=1 Tax=Parabacteroides sp. PF5-6 TaxID=1742403 RepID=UPI00240611AA|nr:hypothetical protein [Parabacteroides sp. PF5-6]MDF9831508.1 hypothetical protein [Parabacteroides sp. PF5-6]